MIDFIKVVYKDKSKVEPFMLRQENFEKVYSVFELHSEEIYYPYKINLDILDIKITGEIIEIKNSLHKLYNSLSGEAPHNYDDFTYSSLNRTIDYLNNKLLDLKYANLTQLEFGLNIPVMLPAKDIITDNILMHKDNAFNQNSKFNGRGCLIRFDYTNFLIKIYDKANQYQLNKNILRFEIKLIRKKEFNVLGIYNLIDLQSKEKLRALFKYLLKRFDEMIIIDDFNSVEITERDRLKLNEFSSYRYWEQVNKRFSRQTKMRYRKDFKLLLQTYNLLKTKKLLRTSLLDKFNFLIDN